MKKIAVFLSLILVALCGYLFYMNKGATQTIATLKVPLEITVSTGEVKEQTLEEAQSESETEKPLQDKKKCYIWGKHPEGATAKIAFLLRQQGLHRDVVISDDFLPERYIVFLGPLKNKTSLRAFAKQLRQQGYKKVRPIERGALAPGIEIAEFENEQQAAAYIEAGKAPEISGIRVIKRLGEPSGKVNLLFQALDETQAKALFSLAKRYKSATVRECPKD